MTHSDHEETEYTLAVCINNRFSSDRPSCGAQGGTKIAEALEAGIRERKIAVNVERLVCFGACYKGPNVRLVPGGAFHHNTTLDDVDAILDEAETRCGHRAEDDGVLAIPGA